MSSLQDLVEDFPVDCHPQSAVIADDKVSGDCVDCVVRVDEVFPLDAVDTADKADDNTDGSTADRADGRAAVGRSRMRDEVVLGQVVHSAAVTDFPVNTAGSSLVLESFLAPESASVPPAAVDASTSDYSS